MSIGARPIGTPPCPRLGRTTPWPPRNRLDRPADRPASARPPRARAKSHPLPWREYRALPQPKMSDSRAGLDKRQPIPSYHVGSLKWPVLRSALRPTPSAAQVGTTPWHHAEGILYFREPHLAITHLAITHLAII